MNEVKSTHQAELVKIQMEKHPNADTLSIIPIFGYTYVGRTETWQGVEYGVWFPPDTLVDTHLPAFHELIPDGKYNADSSKGGSFARIKAKKLRGVVSYGYMIPATAIDINHPDLFSFYGAAHYDPPMQNVGNGVATGGEVGHAPKVYHVKYDVDSFQRYAQQMFVEGEPVFVTEKIHGANGRWVFEKGEFFCGSRTEWKKEFATPPDPTEIEKGMRAKLAGKMADEEIETKVAAMRTKFESNASKPQAQNMWWKALRQYPEIMQWLQENEGTVLYGEVYGAVQNMKYGVPAGEVRIAIFDMLKDGKWVDAEQFNGYDFLPRVPVLASFMPYDFDKLVELAEGPSLIAGANHFREGIVVRTMKERNHPRLGRCNLKIVSPSYLESK